MIRKTFALSPGEEPIAVEQDVNLQQTFVSYGEVLLLDIPNREALPRGAQAALPDGRTVAVRLVSGPSAVTCV